MRRGLCAQSVAASEEQVVVVCQETGRHKESRESLKVVIDFIPSLALRDKWTHPPATNRQRTGRTVAQTGLLG